MLLAFYASLKTNSLSTLRGTAVGLRKLYNDRERMLSILRGTALEALRVLLAFCTSYQVNMQLHGSKRYRSHFGSRYHIVTCERSPAILLDHL